MIVVYVILGIVVLGHAIRYWMDRDDGRLWIVCVERSPFMIQTIVGPFGHRKARRTARRFIAGYPYGAATVLLATETIVQGDRVVWPTGGTAPQGAESVNVFGDTP